MDDNDWDADLPVTIFCLVCLVGILFFVYMGFL